MVLHDVGPNGPKFEDAWREKAIFQRLGKRGLWEAVKGHSKVFEGDVWYSWASVGEGG